MYFSSLNCESPDPADTLTDRLNKLLNSSGPDYILSLCPSTQYTLAAPLRFAAPNQEISTDGYPSGSTRATLVVSGTNQTNAVDGKCANCDGVKLRYVQIDGARRGAPPLTGSANIEMGGSNANQLIEYVHSFDPRGWSCLHVAEGNLSCSNVTVQNNDIGPAGSELFHQWADGISVACRNSSVRNNMINNPTDGGIVLFGSPGTRVENNTIWVETQTLLGGVNMVDVDPYGGSYDGVVVTNNLIAGGFASEAANGSATKGTNVHDTIIKIGIAIGPRTWFRNRAHNISFGGTVKDNRLTGAFGYGIAMSSATNFTVENNVLVANTSFIGARGPNCSTDNPLPSPAAFVADYDTVLKSTTQFDFVNFSSAYNLVCIQAPEDGDLWPFTNNLSSTPSVDPPEPTTVTIHSGLSAGAIAAIVVCPIIGVILVGTIIWSVRRWAVRWLETTESSPQINPTVAD